MKDIKTLSHVVIRQARSLKDNSVMWLLYETEEVPIETIANPESVKDIAGECFFIHHNIHDWKALEAVKKTFFEFLKRFANLEIVYDYLGTQVLKVDWQN